MSIVWDVEMWNSVVVCWNIVHFKIHQGVRVEGVLRTPGTGRLKN